MFTTKSGKSFVLLATLFFVVLCLTSAASACPTCKEGLGHEQANMVRGYFWSILFMMSMPFLIFAGLGSYFYYLVRKAQLEQAATNHEAPSAYEAWAGEHPLEDHPVEKHWSREPAEV